MVIAFKKAIKKNLKRMCINILTTYFILQDNSPKEEFDIISARFNFLADYIFHYKFPTIFGPIFNSGKYSTPLSLDKLTKPKDFISFQVAQNVLYTFIYGLKENECILRTKEEKEHLMRFLISAIIGNLIKSNLINMKHLILLRIAEMNGLELNKIEFFNNLTRKYSNHQFKCTQLVDGHNYLIYCQERGVDIPSQYANNGELLYWKHFSEKEWNLLDGVFISLSNSQFFGINKMVSDEKVFVFSGESHFDINEENDATTIQQVLKDDSNFIHFHFCIGLHSKKQNLMNMKNLNCTFIDETNLHELFGSDYDITLIKKIYECGAATQNNHLQK